MADDLFGTDGVRGRANPWPTDSETVLELRMAAGSARAEGGRGAGARGGRRGGVVMGKDARLSVYMIEQALSAGFLAVGMDVFFFGPLPTPAGGGLARPLRGELGGGSSA